jgi:hypothetical protein
MALYTSISVSPSSREINGSNAFTVSIAYSSSASRLINTKITVAGQTYSIGTVTASSFTWTPPLSLLNSMSTLSSATVTITGTPANSNNFSLVGEISTYCTNVNRLRKNLQRRAGSSQKDLTNSKRPQ